LPHWPDGFSSYDVSNPFLVSAYGIADWGFPEGEYPPLKVFGANMAVRKKIFDQGWRFEGAIGPSQKKNYIMGSESDFLLRLEKAGHSPVYLPDALVCHQIRPEQMSFSWLKNRAYRAGKSSAYKRLAEQPTEKTANCSTFRGVPRYLYRRLIESGFDYALSILFSRPRRIEAGMRFHTLRGTIVGYREKGRV